MLPIMPAPGRRSRASSTNCRRNGRALRLAAFVAASGSAGTLAAGDYLKEELGARIVAVEASECPTLLRNGFGEHNIQGIGDKHVPYIHNVPFDLEGPGGMRSPEPRTETPRRRRSCAGLAVSPRGDWGRVFLRSLLRVFISSSMTRSTTRHGARTTSAWTMSRPFLSSSRPRGRRGCRFLSSSRLMRVTHSDMATSFGSRSVSKRGGVMFLALTTSAGRFGAGDPIVQVFGITFKLG